MSDAARKLVPLPPHAGAPIVLPVHDLDALAAGTRGAVVLANNLPLMAALPAACIDLVYVDPPFFTGVPRRGRLRATSGAGKKGPGVVCAQHPSGRSGKRLLDPFSPRHEAKFDDRWGRSLGNYMPWLIERLAEMRRLLKPTGSLFVHLDFRAVHYVKVALDELFGAANFRNEIIWCYSVGGRPRRAFGRKHDTILFYSRGPKYVFHPDAVRVPRRAGSHMRVAADAAGRPVQEKTDPRTGKVYRYPVHAGKVPEDWWADIETLNHSDEQRTGYPTQKPLRLLQRIIAAASDPGAWVADFFAGSGTTAAAALALGRRVLAVDENPHAVEITRSRLADSGVPCYGLG